MFLILNPGGQLTKPIFCMVGARGVTPITQIKDAKFIVSSSSNLDILMTVGRTVGGEVQPPEGPGNK